MAEHYDATVIVALAAAKAGTNGDSGSIRDALRDVANEPGEVIGPGRAEIARALELIADGKDINYNGAGGDIEFDENGDVIGTIEIWTISGGEIKSTGSGSNSLNPFALEKGLAQNNQGAVVLIGR